jgi:predicted phosphoribosyltransferase
MLTDASLVEAVQALYREMMALSRQEQEKLLREANHA